LKDAAAAGDNDAFTKFDERYQKPIYNLYYRLQGSHGDGEGAFQEVFVKPYGELGKYDLQRPFIPWLFATGKTSD